jgi:hypothetical protein
MHKRLYYFSTKMYILIFSNIHFNCLNYGSSEANTTFTPLV